MDKKNFFCVHKKIIPYMIAGGISLVYFLIVLQSCSPVYAINDDRAMYRIVSGEMTGQPDGHAIFILYPLSWLMSSLFKIFPWIDWYALIMIGSMCFALSLLLYRMVKLEGHRKYWATAGVLLVFHLLMQEHIVMFQFTIVAAVLGAVAVFWIMTMNDESSWGEILVGVLLIFLTFCIRKSVFIMSGPFIVLAYVYRNIRVTGRKIEIKRISAVVLSIVVLCGTIIIHQTAYSSEEWTQFLEYNQVRSQIYDYYGYPDYNKYQKFYEDNKVSREEYDCLKSYNLIMDYEGDFSEKLEKIAQKGKEIHRENIEENLRKSIKSTRVMLQDRGMMVYHMLKITILFMIGILYLKSKNHKMLVLWGIGFLTYLAEYIYLLLKGRLILRVAFAMDIVFIFFSVAIIGLFWKEYKKRAKYGLYVGLLAAIVLSIINLGFMRDEMWSIQYGNEVLAAISGYCKAREENFYFSFGETYITTKNTRIINEEGCWNYTGFGGWVANSPIERKRLERAGIQNVDEALLTKDNVFIIAPDIEMTEKESALREYFDDRYEDVKWERVDTIDLYTVDYIVWKVSGSV